MRQTIRCLREKLRRNRGLPGRRQSGQTLVIVVLGIFVLLVVVGLGVDLGLYYIERVRITRAVDAAALAAAAELPFEQGAHERAKEFLLENGYVHNASTTRLVINGGPSNDPVYGAISGPAQVDASTVITLNTVSYRDLTLPTLQDQLASADRIQIEVIQRVPVVFMQFIGFTSLPAYASATAENINNLDIVIVFDRSGSMEFDTLCYGCWSSSTSPYPGGLLHPLPWTDGDSDGTPDHCEATQAYVSGSYRYYFIEAEEYSRLNVFYDRYLYQPYRTYWVMEREDGDGAAGRDMGPGNCEDGAYISHMPFPDHETSTGYGVCCRYEDVVGGYCNSTVSGGPFPAPRADYDFSVPQNGNYYIWVRGQAANSWGRGDNLDRRLFWGIDGVLGAGSHTGNCGAWPGLVGCEQGFTRGTGYNAASCWNWQWRRLNDSAITWNAGETHTLNLWAGGSNFALDRIVITTDPNGSDGSPPSPMSTNNGRGVAQWANGRTDWACSPCDARFAGYPGGTPDCNMGANPDRRNDDIYDDEQPIRASIEAAKQFVTMLDPRYDQIGYVYYSTNASIRNELECVRRRGVDTTYDPACDEDWSNPGGEPPRDPDCGCFSGVITNTVLYQLEQTTADGNTNIADGMRQGINVLSTQAGHYGRPGAAHVMIVMTDGRANQTPNSFCDDDPDRQWPGGSAAQDCVIYYAHEARNNSIVVYTITLGGSADFELMQAVADITGGVHRTADRAEQLPAIFDELYERIFLRLVE